MEGDLVIILPSYFDGQLEVFVVLECQSSCREVDDFY